MTQITITISNPSDASLIKKFLRKFESVTFETKSTRRKSNYERACEDIELGRCTEYSSVDEAFKDINITI